MQYLVGPKPHTHKILRTAGNLPRWPVLSFAWQSWPSSTAEGSFRVPARRGAFRRRRLLFTDDRARIISQQPATLLTRHTFENYPLGVRPHTTAPMDYLIVEFAWLLGGSVHLDLAGAWISPVLGGLLIVIAAWLWSELRAMPYRWSMLALLSSSPVILHGFGVGRPDHQSLVLFLTGAGLMAESVLWRTRGRQFRFGGESPGVARSGYPGLSRFCSWLSC